MTLAKAGKGPTAVTTLSERWAIVEANAAAISIFILRRFERKESQAPAMLLGRFTPLHKERRAPGWRLAQAGKESTAGCDRRIVQAKAAAI